MRFPPSFLDEIRARIPVSQVVGRRVSLKKRGREFVGLSPFNNEKTPSFTVNDAKGFYHCFSTGKHGDIFTFLIETEGVAFPEAVERLAGEAGIPMPRRDARAEAREKERADLHDVMALAAQFFVDQLQSNAGAKARGYLADRGLSAQTLETFQIGYAPPGRSALKEFLAAKGVTQDAMIATGMLISGDDIPVSYDRFRDRVMFPITDLRRRVIAFGGRALSSDTPAKYLNSPETALFHKGQVLYNIADARQATHDGHELIVAEGYMDVIALSAAGFKGAVAPLGTALTEDQIGLLWRIAEEPTLCFDGDKAGLRAARRSIDIALPKVVPGKSLRYALLPDGQDPDDLIKANGPEAMREVLKRSTPLVDMLWARELEGGDWSTPERRAALEARLGGVIRTIEDETIRRHYREALKIRFEGLLGLKPNQPQAQRKAIKGVGHRNRRSRWDASQSDRRVSAQASPSTARSRLVAASNARVSEREAVILLAVIDHPMLLDEHAELFAELEFTNRDLSSLRDRIMDFVVAGGEVSSSLRPRIELSSHSDVLARLSGAVTHKGYWWLAPETNLADVDFSWNQLVTGHHRSVTLRRELRDAEHALGENPCDETLARIVDLKTQLHAVAGTEALAESYGLASKQTRESF